MQRALLAALIGTGLLLVSSAEPLASEPAMPAQNLTGTIPSPTGLIMHVDSTAGAPLAVIVLDPKERVMAVYHVDRSTGEIALKSVRSLTFDLQLMEYNSREPLPQSIRDMRAELQR
jgi:hypothetical protein